MASRWSAENAAKAYISTLNMGNEAKSKEIDLDESQFISALAAGYNARLMVVACADGLDLTAVALAAAARQTGGRVICILRGHDQIEPSKHVLGLYESDINNVEFMVGEVGEILLNDDDVSRADFVAIDCNLQNHGEIIQALMMEERRVKDMFVLAYNYGFIGGSSSAGKWGGGVRVRLLPIGGGLMMARVKKAKKNIGVGRSNWVVAVDKITGEEHAYRITSPNN
ncbi:uncharacterized protein LOC124925195 [Impatiens glandulifera]|uniref:uncharacterized protein LOC124925195 n=1 Tax=Impatiens glandulifera TaxID=253017 RepID=UPI001FB1320B|nr:uncharacterized protein LOC124925195 [Impatiens glandulifera]